MARDRLRDEAADLWRCKIDAAADRELAALPDRDVVQDAVDTIHTLRANPYLGAALRRYKDLRRIYFDDDRCRIIYRVNERAKTINIIRVRPRKTAYRGMRNPSS